MKPTLAWARNNPTRVAAILTVLLGWAAAAGVPDTVVGGLGTILAVVIGVPLFNAVSPIPHVVEAVREASHEAARATAEALGPADVGLAGSLSTTAGEIADRASNLAADGALRALGVERKDRQ